MHQLDVDCSLALSQPTFLSSCGRKNFRVSNGVYVQTRVKSFASALMLAPHGAGALS